MEKSVESYLQLMAATWRPGTVRIRSHALHSFLSFLRTRHPEVHSFRELKRHPHIEEWLAHLATRHPPYQSATRISLILSLRRFFNDIQEWSWPEAPPPDLLGRADIPHADQRLPKPLSPQVDEILQQNLQADGGQEARALLLLRHTGLRIGELIHLRRDCLLLLPGDTPGIHVPLGKLHEERILPIEPKSAKLIRAFQKQHRKRPAWRNPETGQVVPLLLCREDGKPFCPVRLRTTLKAIARAAGIEDRVHPHRLRHTYATELLRCGMSVVGIMRLLGHRSLGMTLNYVKVTQEDLTNEFHRARNQAEERYASPLFEELRSTAKPDPPPARIAAMAAMREVLARLRFLYVEEKDSPKRRKLEALITSLRKANDSLRALLR